VISYDLSYAQWEGTMKIDGSTKITDVVRIWPGSINIFEKHQMGCFKCLLGETETLSSAAKMHGLNLDDLIKEITELIIENP
jgi:hybrid cluster-associated redox disulfide protein